MTLENVIELKWRWVHFSVLILRISQFSEDTWCEHSEHFMTFQLRGWRGKFQSEHWRHYGDGHVDGAGVRARQVLGAQGVAPHPGQRERHEGSLPPWTGEVWAASEALQSSKHWCVPHNVITTCALYLFYAVLTFTNIHELFDFFRPAYWWSDI